MKPRTAGTVLTIRKQLHPALRGQDHCPGTYQEPSSDPFQKRTLPASILACGPSDAQERSPWPSQTSVVPAVGVSPSAGLALPGRGCAPFARSQTCCGSTLVHRAGWRRQPLPQGWPCSLGARHKSSLAFCRGMGSVRQLLSTPGGRSVCCGLKAPTADTGSDSPVAASVVLQECLQSRLLIHNLCQLWRGLGETGKPPCHPPPLLFLCGHRTTCEPWQKGLLQIYCEIL
ncbi:uncharacterized protein ACIBXB_012284 isoform 1-T1 [Morphnus guianensis]